MKRIIFYVTLITVSSHLFAQSGTITGRISDADNNDPLIGANVIVQGTSMGAATDVDGHYTIQNVPVGAITITITYIGYEDQKQDLTLTLGETVTANIALAREAIQMETYVVTASRRRERVEDAPAAISVITQKEFAEKATQT